MGVCMHMWVYECTLTEVRGQLGGVSFLLPPCEFQKSKLGHLAWQHAFYLLNHLFGPIYLLKQERNLAFWYKIINLS